MASFSPTSGAAVSALGVKEPAALAGAVLVEVQGAAALGPLLLAGSAAAEVAPSASLATAITAQGGAAVDSEAVGGTLAVGYTIAGSVFEEGVPVARTLRAYRRSTGALVGEAISSPDDGGYTIGLLPHRWEVDVLAVPDPGYRPLVHGPILPEPQ